MVKLYSRYPKVSKMLSIAKPWIRIGVQAKRRKSSIKTYHNNNKKKVHKEHCKVIGLEVTFSSH